MAISVQASQAEIERLRELRKAHGYKSEKALIVLLNLEGKTAPEIARCTKRHANVIRQTLKDFKRDRLQSLQRNYSEGRPDTKRQQAINLIKKLVNDSPRKYGFDDDLWSKKAFLEIYKERVGKISPATIERALRDLAYEWSRPSKANKSQEETLEEISSLLKPENLQPPTRIKGWYRAEQGVKMKPILEIDNGQTRLLVLRGASKTDK